MAQSPTSTTADVPGFRSYDDINNEAAEQEAYAYEETVNPCVDMTSGDFVTLRVTDVRAILYPGEGKMTYAQRQAAIERVERVLAFVAERAS